MEVAERSEAAETFEPSPVPLSVRSQPIIADDFSLHLPNIRALFKPRPGHAFVEGDYTRADACVAAWDADATTLKEWVHAGLDFHSSNAQRLYGTVYSSGQFHTVRTIAPRSLHINGMSYRDNAKRWVHGTHFHGGARTLASVLSISVEHCEQCQVWWCEVEHPEIGRWHRRIDEALRSKRMPIIHNAFGFRRIYVGGAPYGRSPGNLLGQALGWICQSTVAIAINKAVERIDCNADLLGRPRCGRCLVCNGAPIILRLQVHDSALLEVPLEALTDELIGEITTAMDVEVPYADPLHIPVDIKWSAESYGAMKKWQ